MLRYTGEGSVRKKLAYYFTAMVSSAKLPPLERHIYASVKCWRLSFEGQDRPSKMTAPTVPHVQDLHQPLGSSIAIWLEI
jgi:hypothetical protein